MTGLRRGCFHMRRGTAAYAMFQTVASTPRHSETAQSEGLRLLCRPRVRADVEASTVSSELATASQETAFLASVVIAREGSVCPAGSRAIGELAACEKAALENDEGAMQFMGELTVQGLVRGCYALSRGGAKFAMFQPSDAPPGPAPPASGPRAMCLRAPPGAPPSTTAPPATEVLTAVKAADASFCPSGTRRILDAATCEAMARGEGVEASGFLGNQQVAGLLRGCYYAPRGEKKFALFQVADVAGSAPQGPRAPKLLCLRSEARLEAGGGAPADPDDDDEL